MQIRTGTQSFDWEWGLEVGPPFQGGRGRAEKQAESSVLGAPAGAGSIVVRSGETSRQEWDGADLGFEDMEMGGGDKDDEIGLLAQEPLECQRSPGYCTQVRSTVGALCSFSFPFSPKLGHEAPPASPGCPAAFGDDTSPVARHSAGGATSAHLDRGLAAQQGEGLSPEHTALLCRVGKDAEIEYPEALLPHRLFPRMRVWSPERASRPESTGHAVTSLRKR
uniref:Uncharacterized protein n=1 Tax=Rangifer tarandus platyrhynchus TaxID=3082113 RepID=A0ACB0DYE6_RANTA|nr:unnamed protein product [Rangifer tarandus platyrhynchus]